jgi:ferredoxin
MDFWLCRMMGVRLEDYPLWQAAAARGMPQCDMDENDLAGDFPASHIWEGLDIPKLDSLNLVPVMSRLPFAKTLEQALMSRPVHRSERCVGCGKCAGMCKAEAISLSGNGKRLTFDYRKCIRCYCCHEMCPVDAIGFQEGLLMKAARWIRRA